jgi:hypothetical protein
MSRFGKDVPVPQRSNRCVRSATLKVLLSGAAAAAAETLSAEAGQLKTEIQGEASVAASLPKLSAGAEILFEHALVSYAQTLLDSAVRLKTSMNMHNKVSLGCMAAAADVVNKQVFGSSTLAPGTVVVDTRRKPKKKAKKADADAGEKAEASEAAEAAASTDA